MIVAIFRSSIWTRVAINHADTKILSHVPCGLQNAIERWSKDLATRGAVRGLVSLSAFRPILSLAKGKYITLHVVDLAMDTDIASLARPTLTRPSIDLLPSAAS